MNTPPAIKLTPAQRFVLTVLEQGGEYIFYTQLGYILFDKDNNPIEGYNVTELANRLRNAGLICYVDIESGEKAVAIITPKGRELVQPTPSPVIPVSDNNPDLKQAV